jgi:hypothetical protein
MRFNISQPPFSVRDVTFPRNKNTPLRDSVSQQLRTGRERLVTSLRRVTSAFMAPTC